MFEFSSLYLMPFSIKVVKSFLIMGSMKISKVLLYIEANVLKNF